MSLEVENEMITDAAQDGAEQQSEAVEVAFPQEVDEQVEPQAKAALDFLDKISEDGDKPADAAEDTKLAQAKPEDADEPKDEESELLETVQSDRGKERVRKTFEVHGRIDRSEKQWYTLAHVLGVHGRIGCSKISFSQQPYRKRLAERGLRLGARQVHGKMCRLLQWLYTWLHFLINVMPSCYKLQAQRLGGICFPSAVYSFAAGRKAGVACHRRYCTW